MNMQKILEEAVEQLPCVVITDEKGRYLYVNEGWCRLMQHSREEVTGKYVHDIVPDTRVDDAIRTGETISGYQIRDGHNNLLFNNCTPVKIDGVVVGVIVVTFFSNLDDALVFSKALEEVTRKMNYYRNELRRFRGTRHHIDEIIGSSAPMNDLREKIRRAAKTTSTVLIEGETGCGKELIANSIHDLSARTEQPFVKVNCAAIPPELVESEFFGYESGAFTGARRGGKSGLFEIANHGSLFLDEINQMSYFIQPKLLRVLQEKEVQHVGGEKLIPVDTRILAATNRSLEQLVAEGQFREDLYYRLNVFHIRTPSLREHISDIPELVEKSVKRLNYELGSYVEGVTDEVMEKLMGYSWPGNVRELNNVLERAMNTQPFGVLKWNCFEEYFSQRSRFSADFVFSSNRDDSHKTWKEKTERTFPVSDTSADSLRRKKEEQERELILQTLEACRYNKTRTAAALGISRTMLYQKLRKYQI